MIDLNPDCMMMLDSDCRILRANRACLDLVGNCDFSETLGASVFDLFQISDPGELASLFDSSAQARDCRVNAVLQDRTCTLRFSVVGHDADSGAVFVVVSDLTDQMAEDAATEKTHKITAVKQLLGAMMHHFNQPLTVIMLRANMLTSAMEKQKASPDSIREALDEISDMAMRIANVLKKVESLDEFETQRYIDGLDIMRLEGK